MQKGIKILKNLYIVGLNLFGCEFILDQERKYGSFDTYESVIKIQFCEVIPHILLLISNQETQEET